MSQSAKPLSKVESEMQKGRRFELKVKTTFPNLWPIESTEGQEDKKRAADVMEVCALDLVDIKWSNQTGRGNSSKVQHCQYMH